MSYNRFLMQISWIDAKVVPDTLTSIQNALERSVEPTEILLLLNEQTFLDTPLEGKPSDTWRYFMDHPLIPKCNIKTFTNDDPFLGPANSRRDYITKEGLTYWGESDCLVPKELFQVAEKFHQDHMERPYIMTFAIRKMWPGWENIEHSAVKRLSLDILPSGDFLRCDSPMSLEKLYEFNDKQCTPEVVLVPVSRIEGAMTILSEGLPEPLIAPDLDFYHEDFCLELAMRHYGIPQYHVQNILKGHDMRNPNKRSNIKAVMQFSDEAQKRKDRCFQVLDKFIKELYAGKFKK